MRQVCAYCGGTIEDGPEPVSHGLCEHVDCVRVATQPITAETLIQLHNACELAWGRHMTNRGASEEWEQARTRFEAATREALNYRRAG